jgi:hypothetical protein
MQNKIFSTSYEHHLVMSFGTTSHCREKFLPVGALGDRRIWRVAHAEQ